jgi:hypothetical protein
VSDRRREIAEEAKERGQHALGLLWDAGFLVVWLLIQWAVERVRQALPLSEPDAFVFTLFQWTLGGSTLILILIWVCRDLAVVGIRAIKQVRRELHRR